MRAIKLFERDLTHNNVVSGLQGDSSFCFAQEINIIFL